MARKLDGLAVGVIGTGGLLAYAGVKGYSVPHALQAFVKGKVPTGPADYGITGNGSSGTSSGSPGGSAGDATAGASEQSFFTAMLADLGARPTQPNLLSCYAWARREEPGFPPQSVGGYAWNPLNIKNPATGQFYVWPSSSAGAHGTAAFITGEGYTAIVAAFRGGTGLCGNPAVASELSAWSGGGYSSVC